MPRLPAPATGSLSARVSERVDEIRARQKAEVPAAARGATLNELARSYDFEIYSMIDFTSEVAIIRLTQDVAVIFA